MQLAENVVLGLDIGIGSLGWALIRENPETLEKELISRTTAQGEVHYALGVRLISVPEEKKTKELLNVHRRQARMQRRVIKRRAKRMRALRALLIEHGVPEVADVVAFHTRLVDPWRLRKEGLERLLSAEEWACVLIHMAKHRGFKSNSKRDKASGDAETGKVLSAVATLRRELEDSGLPTVGALLAERSRKRNRNDYTGTANYTTIVLRSLLEEETDMLFSKQAEFHNLLATDALRDAYKQRAFTQRPLASVSHMVGPCAFIQTEKRSPRFAPTAERFRLAQRLTILRLCLSDGNKRPLSSEEIQTVVAELGKQQGISYKSLRKILQLDASTLFDGLGYGRRNKKGKEDDPEKADIVTRTGACATGTYTLREVLGEKTFQHLGGVRVEAEKLSGWLCLDAVIKIISDNDDPNNIAGALALLPLGSDEQHLLISAVEEGRFAFCKGTMNLCTKAMEAITLHMLEGNHYAAACELTGFDHSKERQVDINDIRNPVVQHLLREIRRQCKTIMHEFKVIPGRVHIELLRDVGKSPDERKEIEKGINERTEKKKKAREELAKLFGTTADTISPTELMRYELWKAQEGRCAYYGLWKKSGAQVYTGAFADGGIPVDWLKDASNAAQIDHILPRSRTFDNSFHNLCLCCSSANQAKGNKTPFEWLGKENPQAWHDWSIWIRNLPIKGLKKRNFLLENLDADMENRFHARNLTDSSYVSRLVSRWFREEYEHLTDTPDEDENGPRRVFARPGSVTDFLRKEWGVQGLKKDAAGKRIGDRHHALDALIVACCTEGLLQRVTKLFQKGETHAERVPLPVPWKDFRATAPSLLETVFVSRAERAKTTGALHEETLRSIRVENNESGEPTKILYERQFVGDKKFTEDSLSRIKDAHRCPDVVEALRLWLAVGKPKDELPLSSKGDVIRHVRVRVKDNGGRFTSGVELARGSGKAQASNGEMVRTDVYTKGGKFYLVPVYTKQVADGELPVRAIVGGKPKAEWLVMDAGYEFCFSLIKDCFVFIKQSTGKCIEGYFAGTDRATAAIAVSLAHDRQETVRGIGVQRLKLFQKYRIDRMGRRHLVTHEPDPRERYELEGNSSE